MCSSTMVWWKMKGLKMFHLMPPQCSEQYGLSFLNASEPIFSRCGTTFERWNWASKPLSLSQALSALCYNVCFRMSKSNSKEARHNQEVSRQSWAISKIINKTLSNPSVLQPEGVSVLINKMHHKFQPAGEFSTTWLTFPARRLVNP